MHLSTVSFCALFFNVLSLLLVFRKSTSCSGSMLAASVSVRALFVRRPFVFFYCGVPARFVRSRNFRPLSRGFDFLFCFSSLLFFRSVFPSRLWRVAPLLVSYFTPFLYPALFARDGDYAMFFNCGVLLQFCAERVLHSSSFFKDFHSAFSSLVFFGRCFHPSFSV
jgi:hypothetical protein